MNVMAAEENQTASSSTELDHLFPVLAVKNDDLTVAPYGGGIDADSGSVDLAQFELPFGWEPYSATVGIRIAVVLGCLLGGFSLYIIWTGHYARAKLREHLLGISLLLESTGIRTRSSKAASASTATADIDAGLTDVGNQLPSSSPLLHPAEALLTSLHRTDALLMSPTESGSIPSLSEPHVELELVVVNATDSCRSSNSIESNHDVMDSRL